MHETSNHIIKRYQPSSDLAHFVDYYWIARTDGAKEYEAALAEAGVTILITPDQAQVRGLSTSKTPQNLPGASVTLGIVFKPGGFYPFYKKPIDRLTNQTMPLSTLYSVTRIKKVTAELQSNDREVIQACEKLLRAKRPEYDVNIEAINQIITRIAQDDQLDSVQAVCDAYELSERTLQRTFQHYVGIGLKWIVSHYRTKTN